MDTGHFDMLRSHMYAYARAYESGNHRLPVMCSDGVVSPFGVGRDAAINFMNETKRERVGVLLYRNIYLALNQISIISKLLTFYALLILANCKRRTVYAAIWNECALCH